MIYIDQPGLARYAPGNMNSTYYMSPQVSISLVRRPSVLVGWTYSVAEQGGEWRQLYACTYTNILWRCDISADSVSTSTSVAIQYLCIARSSAYAISKVQRITGPGTVRYSNGRRYLDTGILGIFQVPTGTQVLNLMGYLQYCTDTYRYLARCLTHANSLMLGHTVADGVKINFCPPSWIN